MMNDHSACMVRTTTRVAAHRLLLRGCPFSKCVVLFCFFTKDRSWVADLQGTDGS